ncbi:MAG: DNA replication and repair protein RecF [Labilithrix sp.]|nr:DNA replication and repair protein RecF [Labilithrix sp.]MCW5810395.1 DNA replication and repair protein RecF [Labilithrix sp.]
MLRSLAIEAVQVRSFRNLAAVDVELGPRFNVISGANGQGKTNLLEALYVLGTSKSFRSSKMTDVVAFEGELASVRARVREEGDSRVQSVGIRAGARLVRVDDKRPPTLAAYAVRTPIVVFHPGEIALSMGASAERRRLLDRTALYRAPAAMLELESYTKAVRSRQRALDTRGVQASDLGEWETLIVRHGTALMDHRAEAAASLSERALEAFRRIAAPDLSLAASYAPGAPRDAEAFAAALIDKRAADLRRGSATVGPHRDDLALSISGHPVRGVASQGQHRAVTLALKSAEIDVIGAARGVRPVLLLDDVSSELDRERTAALFAFLREQEGQVVLTTTRPELIDSGAGQRRDFTIDGGRLSRVDGGFLTPG